ncbi:hypothetical protein chiPu_0027953, partial [Chiloscyllium punctatum]|nr:hypothetical protein [Chiloscyllium punctatum]
MRRRAQAGIDHQRDVGQAVAQKFQRVAVGDAFGAADWSCPRHHHLAAGFDQARGDREILGAIGEHFKAVLDQDSGGLDQADDVGLQRVVVGDHLELDPGRAEQFARELGSGDRLAHAAAARGVRQHGDAELADQGPERIAGLAASGFTAERYGDDAGAGGADRVLHDRRRGVERRADQQAGREGFAVEG